MKTLRFYKENWLILSVFVSINLISIALLYYSSSINSKLNYKYSLRQDRVVIATQHQDLRDNIATTRNLDTVISRKNLESFTLDEFNRYPDNYDLTKKYKNGSLNSDYYWNQVLNFYNNLIVKYGIESKQIATEIYKLSGISDVSGLINFVLTIILFPINFFFVLVLNKRYESFSIKNSATLVAE